MAEELGGDAGERPPGAREAGVGPAPADWGLTKEVPADAMRLASPLGERRGERLLTTLRYLVSGYRPEPVPAHRGPVEPPRKGKTGISCSGGGIRSAAFN